MSLEHVDPNKPTARDRANEAEASRRTRPTGAPRSEKNFIRLTKDIDPDNEELAEAEEADESGESKSLFDLSAKKNKLSTTKPIMARKSLHDQEQDTLRNPDSILEGTQDAVELPEDKNDDLGIVSDEELAQGEEEEGVSTFTPTVTPAVTPTVTPTVFTPTVKQPPLVKQPPEMVDNFSLNEAGRRSAAMNTAKKGTMDTKGVATSDSTTLTPKKDKTKLDSKSRAASSEESPDLAAIHSDRQKINLSTEKPEIEEEVTHQSTIRELADKLIEKIQTMRTEGRTDTTVTLRHPPLLEGSSFTLSALDGAKREFNISFTNLSQAAKIFLDAKLTEDNLSQILERKGIIIHALVTTTLAEIPITTDTEKFFARDQQKQQQQQQDKGEERREKGESESES